VKLTTYLHLMPRSRIRGAIPPLPEVPSLRGAQLKHRDKFTFHIQEDEFLSRSGGRLLREREKDFSMSLYFLEYNDSIVY
jgi:hypothetical protein